MIGLFGSETHTGSRSYNRRTEKTKRRECRASSETSLHFPSCLCVPEGDSMEMSPVVRKLQSDLSPVGFTVQFQQVTKYRCPLWLIIQSINPVGQLWLGARSLKMEKEAHEALIGKMTYWIWGKQYVWLSWLNCVKTNNTCFSKPMWNKEEFQHPNRSFANSQCKSRLFESEKKKRRKHKTKHE